MKEYQNKKSSKRNGVFTNKKITCSLLLITTILLNTHVSANEQFILSDKYPIVNSYTKQYKGKRNIESTKALLNDKCFTDANTFIYDKEKQKDIKVSVGDPESKNKRETVVTKSPDYGSALTALAECVNKTSNPIAAWEGLFIIKSFFGIDYKKNINAYKKFSKILYEDKSCDGFINQGDIYKNGIGEKVDTKIALNIYTEGLQVCKEDWQNMVLTMRVNSLKQKEKLKK